MKDLNSELGSRASTPLNTGSVFLFNFKATVKEKCFISILYQILETGTSDRTLLCLNQLLRFSGFSLYPFLFSFTVTLIIILGICIYLLLLFIKGCTFPVMIKEVQGESASFRKLAVCTQIYAKTKIIFKNSV